MMQVLTQSRSGVVTSASTAKAAFTDVPCRMVHLQAAITNTGTVTISTTDSISTSGVWAAGGLTRTAGEDFPPMWIENLNQLSYTCSVSGDKINVLIAR